MLTNIPSIIGVVFVSAVAASSGNPVPEDSQPKLVTRIYDLTPILGDKSATTGLPDTEAVIRKILETIKVEPLKPHLNSPRVVEREGG